MLSVTCRRLRGRPSCDRTRFGCGHATASDGSERCHSITAQSRDGTCEVHDLGDPLGKKTVEPKGDPRAGRLFSSRCKRPGVESLKRRSLGASTGETASVGRAAGVKGTDYAARRWGSAGAKRASSQWRRSAAVCSQPGSLSSSCRLSASTRWETSGERILSSQRAAASESTISSTAPWRTRTGTSNRPACSWAARA